MSKLKSLAGQTAIYGIPSILGRMINYLLVMLHTAIFLEDEMGVFSGLYANVAILLVVYTFGMETTFFRFINKKIAERTYDSAFTIVFIISTLSSAIIFFNAEAVAHFLKYDDYSLLVKWLAIILWLDGLMAIPFARLRQLNQARKFALLKLFNIFCNVGLQLVFLLLLPWLKNNFGVEIMSVELGIGFIVLANLIANALLIIPLWNHIKAVRLCFHWHHLKPLLIYGTPIFVMGLAGMLNEYLDKATMDKLLSNDFYADLTAQGALGVYSQVFKLSIFMMLAIQAFRYAAEPFFFKEAEDKNAPTLYARVMHYFIICSLFILLAVSINVDLIGFIFLRNEVYRTALYLVPILLTAKFFFGIYTNLNIWFKITDRPIYGVYISTAGAVVTIIGNVLLIPRIGFLGSAITAVVCYLVMCIWCFYLGKKYYPIPYRFAYALPYVIIYAVAIIASFYFKHEDFVIDSVINIFVSLFLILLVAWREKRRYLKNATYFS